MKWTESKVHAVGGTVVIALIVAFAWAALSTGKAHASQPIRRDLIILNCTEAIDYPNGRYTNIVVYNSSTSDGTVIPNSTPAAPLIAHYLSEGYEIKNVQGFNYMLVR